MHISPYTPHYMHGKCSIFFLHHFAIWAIRIGLRNSRRRCSLRTTGRFMNDQHYEMIAEIPRKPLWWPIADSLDVTKLGNVHVSRSYPLTYPIRTRPKMLWLTLRIADVDTGANPPKHWDCKCVSFVRQFLFRRLVHFTPSNGKYIIP
jgi:hypothetical protein